MMNLRHLQFVIGVAEHGGFRRAAEALSVSQPTLSHAIGSLEDQLGTALFSRSGNRVALTTAGEDFIAYARKVLDAYHALESKMRSETELTAVRLPVAVLATTVTSAICQVVASLRESQPGIVAEIRTRKTPFELDEELLNGQCEVGLTARPAHRSLVTEHLYDEEFQLVFPPGFDVGPSPIPQDMEFGVPMIVPSGGLRLADASLDVPGFNPRNRVAVECETRELTIPLILRGVGAAYLPRPLALIAEASGARAVALEPPLRRPVWLVRRAEVSSPAAQAFVDAARSALSAPT